MTENKTSKMNLDHERKIVELQERVNKLEDLCFTTKEILNLEEASAFLGIAKSTLYKMTHLNLRANSSSLKRKPCLIGCAAQSPCRRKKSERKQPQD